MKDVHHQVDDPSPPSRDERPGVAIVGGGPRGLQALDLLNAQLARSRAACSLGIDVFEPRESIGSGPNYDTALPEPLRINLAARHVEAGTPRADGGGREQPSFVAWLAQHHPAWADEYGFPPRALVGAYLQACARRTIASLRAHGCRVRHFQGRVTAIERGSGPGRWCVRFERHAFEYDHVLLTTGHDSSRRRNIADRWWGRLTHVVPDVYADDGLRIGAVFDGASADSGSATVALRGFALTSFDAMLLLTEGRGGRFESRGLGQMSYTPSEQAPVELIPFSRTGLPMLAKPDPRRVRSARILEDVWTAGRREVAIADDLDGVRKAIVSASARALARSRDLPPHESPSAVRSVRARLERVSESRPVDRAGARAMLRASIAVGVGVAAVDSDWALGEGWRQLYPALVEWIGQSGHSPEARERFAHLGRCMERVAFGPPIGTAARLIALEDAGVLNLGFLTDPALSSERGRLILEADGRRTSADMLVDAVSAAPGIDETSELLGPLLTAGIVRVLPGTHGLEVDRASRPIDRHGAPLQGLAVVGRATEGCVLGLDTLSRTLHDHLRVWAGEVVAATSFHGFETLH